MSRFVFLGTTLAVLTALLIATAACASSPDGEESSPRPDLVNPSGREDGETAAASTQAAIPKGPLSFQIVDFEDRAPNDDSWFVVPGGWHVASLTVEIEYDHGLRGNSLYCPIPGLSENLIELQLEASNGATYSFSPRFSGTNCILLTRGVRVRLDAEGLVPDTLASIEGASVEALAGPGFIGNLGVSHVDEVVHRESLTVQNAGSFVQSASGATLGTVAEVSVPLRGGETPEITVTVTRVRPATLGLAHWAVEYEVTNVWGYNVKTDGPWCKPCVYGTLIDSRGLTHPLVGPQVGSGDEECYVPPGSTRLCELALTWEKELAEGDLANVVIILAFGDDPETLQQLTFVR